MHMYISCSRRSILRKDVKGFTFSPKPSILLFNVKVKELDYQRGEYEKANSKQKDREAAIAKVTRRDCTTLLSR